MLMLAYNTLIQSLIFVMITFNSVLFIYDINTNSKFSVDGLVFCPVFGSVDRCDLAILVNLVGIFTVLILGLSELFFKKKNTRAVELLKKNKKSIILVQVALWLIMVFFLLYWTTQLNADAIEKQKNLYYGLLNLFLFVGIFLFSLFENYQ
nr:hypothetical protein 1634Bnrm1_p068 [Cryptomonas sp.]